MSKKVLVCSLGARSTAENYGAVIQIDAFSYFLKEHYDADVTILDYLGKNISRIKTKNFINELMFNNSFKDKIRKMLFGRKVQKRFKKNINYLKKNKMTSLVRYQEINNLNLNFDYYVAESDVIWDPSFRKSGFDELFFLNTNAFENGKRIVYSAGLGDANYNENEKKQFLSLIKNLDKWSVREEYSKEFLETFVDGQIELTLDPTLLVEKKYYLEIVKRYSKPKKEYVLVYSPAFNNMKMINDAKLFAKKHNLDIIIIKRLPSKKDYFKTKIDVGVDEFLSLLYYSRSFFCDSFHGVCLSVMLEKEFYVYEREDGRKIFDICHRLGLENNLVTNDFIEHDIDFLYVNSRLEEEKKKSIQFLDLCFNK